MFDGLSAWFSSSVSKKKRKLWVEHGGMETSLEDAQFIFSRDTTASDTERVFESEPYIEEHLAVFHPSYIKECVKRGNIQHVVLGKYFFPPGDVQTIARKQLQYQWDLDGNTSDGEAVNLSDEEEPAPMSRGQNKEPMPVSRGQNKKPTAVSRGQNKEPASARLREQYKNSQQSKTTCSVLPESDKSGQPHINDKVVTKTLAAIPGTSKDVYTKDNVKQSKGNCNKSVIDSTGSNQPSTCIDNDVLLEKSPRRSTRTVTDRSRLGVLQGKSPRKGKSPSKGGDTDSTNLKRKHEETFPRQLSIDQNVIEDQEVLRLEDLAKVSGDLQDFIIGTKGCELVKI